MSRPNVYELGASPEIIMAFTDEDNAPFVPFDVRLSIEQPDGVVLTVSGVDMVTLSGGILSYTYSPPIVGWYSYESWGKDTSTPPKQIAKSSGFEVVDTVLE